MEWFFFAIIAALFFGTRQVISKKVLLYAHATEFLTVTCAMTFLFSLFFLPKLNFNYEPTIYLLMYFKGLLLTVGWLLGSKALRHLEISMVTPLTNLTPIFLLIFSFVILEEIPSIMQYCGVGLIIIGAYWLQSDHKFRNLIRPWRVLKNKFSFFMIIAIFFYSLCAVIDKIVLVKADPYTFLSVTYLVLTVHYLIIQFFKYEGMKDIKHAFVNGKYLIFVIALLLLFSDIFYFFAVAIPGAMISLIVPVKRMSTLVATVVGGRLFHDHNLIQRGIACVIMIMGVVLIVI